MTVIFVLPLIEPNEGDNDDICIVDDDMYVKNNVFTDVSLPLINIYTDVVDDIVDVDILGTAHDSDDDDGRQLKQENVPKHVYDISIDSRDNSSNDDDDDESSMNDSVDDDDDEGVNTNISSSDFTDMSRSFVLLWIELAKQRIVNKRKQMAQDIQRAGSNA